MNRCYLLHVLIIILQKQESTSLETHKEVMMKVGDKKKYSTMSRIEESLSKGKRVILALGTNHLENFNVF